MPLRCRFLGRVPYADAAALQETLVERVRRGDASDTLLLLTHPPVITLGRNADPAHVVISDEARAAAGIELHDAGRGGDVTFHGDGQLVGYPIVALREGRRDAHAYLRDLEEALIAAAFDHGVAAGRIPGLTGVWSRGAKLAAIGVRISTGWITSHGFALNVGSDLSGFASIVPCGIEDRGLTSLSSLTGRELTPESVARGVADRVAGALGLTAVWAEPDLAPLSGAALSSAAVHGERR
jgi:lipoyl(octanoyl) transferase